MKARIVNRLKLIVVIFEATSRDFQCISMRSTYVAFSLNVTIALIKGVAIAFCCRTGKIPYKQICFLTSFEPNKVYLGRNRNNKGVARTLLSGRKRPDFNRFPSTCPTSLTSCNTWSYPCPVIYYCDPLPFRNSGSHNKFRGGEGGSVY